MAGTFIGVKYSEETKALLKEWMSKVDIPNPIDVETLHTTIIFDKLLQLPYGKQPVKWAAWKHDFRIFDNRKDPEKFTLVMALMAPELFARHIYYRVNHGAHHDFPDYVPHITLSYDVPFDYDHRQLEAVQIPWNFYIVEEYIAPIDEDWTGKDKRKVKR